MELGNLKLLLVLRKFQCYFRSLIDKMEIMISVIPTSRGSCKNKNELICVKILWNFEATIEWCVRKYYYYYHWPLKYLKNIRDFYFYLGCLCHFYSLFWLKMFIIMITTNTMHQAFLHLLTHLTPSITLSGNYYLLAPIIYCYSPYLYFTDEEAKRQENWINCPKSQSL